MNIPKLRFKEFTDEWTFTTLKDVAIKVNRIEANNSPIMMISAEKGFILQSQKYSKDMTGDSLKKYITLYKNELAYNHGASKLRPYGSVFMLLEDKARIPFVYHCFKIINGYNKFYSYYLNRYSFGKLLKPLISSTARMDGLLNISFDNYFSIKFKIPQLKEQEKIANLLTTVDKKITNLENIITSLENQKKGLLQQIFSQKLRFKDKNGNNYPNWEKKKLEDISNITMGQSPDSDFVNTEKIGTPFLQGNAEFTNKYPIEKYWCTKPQKIANPTDILLSVRAPVGAINIANKKFCIGRGLSAISFNCNKLFGKYNLKFNLFQLIKKSQGSTFSSINKKDISEVILFIPCLEEQTKIADFLSAFDRKLENQKAQLEHWKQIKKGLLQQMFV